MTLSEAKNFYREDEKKYELKENKQFRTWFNKIKKNGYRTYFELDDLQVLINTIVNWYELKYPNRALDIEYGKKDIYFNKFQSEFNSLSINDLLYHMSNKSISILEARYRSLIGGNNQDRAIDIRLPLKMDGNSTYFKNPELFISADSLTGRIYDNNNLEEYLNDKSINIIDDEDLDLISLYKVLNNKYKDDIDSNNLSLTLYIHDCDELIRKYILELVALKLLYSKNTYPEYGYVRAKRFIDEFNLAFFLEKNINLNLSSKEIDEIISKNYHKEKITVSRMIEIENDIKNEKTDLKQYNKNDLDYLSLAFKMPYNDLLQEINIYHDERFFVDGLTFIKMLMKKYESSEEEVRSRLIDVQSIIKYDKKMNSKILKKRS